MTTRSDTRIDGFELLERLGRGPRAEVWRARTFAGEEVALKLFHSHITQRPNFLTLFEKETAALVAIAHPNILGAIERSKSGDDYYLVMKLMRSGSLRKRMTAGKMSVHEVVDIGLGVCDALDYAHRRGLVHRNLVLDNLFTSDAGTALVADFGLALLNHRTAGEDPYGVRGDFHALGSAMYELLVGEPPAPPYALMTNRLPGVAPRVVEILAKALAPDPSERFSRATEMALALRLASAQSGNSIAEEDDALTFHVAGDVITVKVARHATALNSRSAVERLNSVLNQGGPWVLAYDFGGVTHFDDSLSEVLLRTHTRHQRRIARVAFCSPRALVRSSMLVLGGSVKRVPWKMFSEARLMQQWLSQEGTQ